ncbi:unnamed protein product [Adineta steineri]|uniref:Uncharacterized protein n=2 Tax=Adineta steineri TaxID=433720 RepID=A0A819QGV2_9BILA|nr:unnamed protein product [Adineta steineri]
MENFNAYYNPLSNTLLPPEFAELPLDMYLDDDDDEFRAGYPFSDVTETEIDESRKSSDCSLAADDDTLQCDSLSNALQDTSIVSTKKDGQLESLSSNQQGDKAFVATKYCRVNACEESLKNGTTEQTGYNKLELNDVLRDVIDRTEKTNRESCTCSYRSKTHH